MTFPEGLLASTANWMNLFRADWHSDIPLRIHSSTFAGDGTYDWSPEFKAWMNGYRDNDERRYRLTKAMRKLRGKSPREYEVAYRMIVHGEPIEETTRWLNDRAVRNNKDDRYTVADTRVIIISAVDKLLAWY